MATKPIKLISDALHLNAKCDFGEIVLEVVSSEGKRLGRSRRVECDKLDIPLEWENQFEVPKEPVTLVFKLKNARLFALWCK